MRGRSRFEGTPKSILGRVLVDDPHDPEFPARFRFDEGVAEEREMLLGGSSDRRETSPKVRSPRLSGFFDGLETCLHFARVRLCPVSNHYCTVHYIDMSASIRKEAAYGMLYAEHTCPPPLSATPIRLW